MAARFAHSDAPQALLIAMDGRSRLAPSVALERFQIAAIVEHGHA